MDYFHEKTKKRYTAALLSMMGLNLENKEAVEFAGFKTIEYKYPTHDKVFTTYKPKEELAKKEDGNYVQEFDIVDLPLEDAKRNLKEAITAKRWEFETGGTMVPEFGKVMTGIEDQNRISATVIGLKASAEAGNPVTEVDFKGVDGWVKISAEQLTQLAAVLVGHVEACFANERRLHEAVDKIEKMDDLKKLDINAGWPPNAVMH